MMDKTIDKYPYKKGLYFSWYEAGIANLILFKYLRQKFANHIYFLISQQGIMLKATSATYLRNAEDQIDRFFNAKIDQMDLSASSDFYEHIMADIKEQTQKLKDKRDCPYINLVYSDKLKNSCLALKKFGYTRPYENWQIAERQRKGFCYLIVRPEHRWKQIANNVLALVKKRQQASQKPLVNTNWTIQMNYQKFIWFYLQPKFQKIKDSLEIIEKKDQTLISVCFKQDSTSFMDFDKIIKSLEYRYCDEPISLKNQEKQTIVILSALEIQKVTELIYHEFGLPNLVRVVRSKGLKYLIMGSHEELTPFLVPQIKLALLEKPKFHLRQDIAKIKDDKAVAVMLKLGKRHDLVSYNGLNFVMVRFEIPLRQNPQNFLKHRLPSLPRYFYYIERNKEIYLLRRFQQNKFRGALDVQPLTQQIFLMNSFILIMTQLHRRGIAIGNNLNQNVYVEGLRVIFQPAEIGNIEEDRSKLVFFVRQWVKSLKNCEIKNDLEKLSDPLEMLPIFDTYLNDNYI